MRTTRSVGAFPRAVFALILTLALAVAGGTIHAEELAADSTNVRIPETPEKSLGDRLLDIPEEILKVPVRVVELLTRGVIEAIFTSKTLYNLASGLLSLEPVDGFYPVLGYSVNGGFKAGPGYRRFDLFTPGDRFFVNGYYSTHDYQKYRIRYQTPYFLHKNIGTHLVAQYRKRTRENFFGLGNGSVEDNEVAFTLEETSIANTLTWRVARSIELGLLSGFTKSNLYDGRDPGLPGDLDIIRDTLGLTEAHTRRTEFWRVGASFRHDWRDHPGQPSSGGVEEISIEYYQGMGVSDDLEFVKTKVEVHHFFNLFKKRILAFRLVAQEIGRESGTPTIPFYLQSGLGGEDYLRGYTSERFVDSDMALLSVEYRYPLFDKVDAFIFLDEARVFGSLRDDFTLEDWHYTAGGGFRAWSSRGVSVMGLVGASREDVRVSLELGSEF